MQIKARHCCDSVLTVQTPAKWCSNQHRWKLRLYRAIYAVHKSNHFWLCTTAEKMPEQRATIARRLNVCAAYTRLCVCIRWALWNSSSFFSVHFLFFFLIFWFIFFYISFYSYESNISSTYSYISFVKFVSNIILYKMLKTFSPSPSFFDSFIHIVQKWSKIVKPYWIAIHS